MRVLNILSTGYRATLEEQDDTVLWLTQSLRRSSAPIDLLLRASAANYVIEGQEVSPLAIGGRTQRNFPDVHGQVRDLAQSGAGIFVIEEDLARYGLLNRPILQQARIVGATDLPDLIGEYDRVWHW